MTGEGPFLTAALASLGAELDSARASGFRSEAILIMDRPSPTTRTMAMTFAESNEDVVVSDSPGVGLTAALNHGLGLTRGRNIARFDGDDVMLPGRISSQLRVLADNDDIVLVGGQILRWSNGRVRSASSLPLDHRNIVRSLLHGRHALNHSSCMMPALALDRVGGYRMEGPAEDWDLFLSLSEIGQLVNLGQPVTLYRYHPGSVTAKNAVQVQLGILNAVDRHAQRPQGRTSAVSPRPGGRSYWRVLQARRRASAQVWYRRSLHADSRVAQWASLVAAGVLDTGGAFVRMKRDLAVLRSLSFLTRRPRVTSSDGSQTAEIDRVAHS